MEEFEDYVDEGVLDRSTLKTLYDLSGRDVFTALGGAISTGKEADVFHALRWEEELAVKVYRTATSAFKEMREHLLTDPRIDKIGRNRRDVVYEWTGREYANLLKAESHVRVPGPVARKKNVLVMEFIGEDEMRAPSLREMESEDWDRAARHCIQMVSDLYSGGLVHGDFSEYNVLVMGELVLIDFSQSVTTDHPMAEEFLWRDIGNLVRFFDEKDVSLDKEGVLEEVKEDPG